MRLRTWLIGGAMAGVLMAAAPASASANIMWCVGDPPSQIVSATGTRFVVNTSVYASSSHLHLATQYTVATTAAPDGRGGTLVTVEVRSPAGQYLTVVSSVQRSNGSVTGRGSGSGDIVVVLDVPIG
jgi:hypothetical protein